jgi:hypothetical protein
MKNISDELLVDTVVSLLDDQNGIPEKSVALLMQVISAINPTSKSLEYLAEASIFRGRAFLPEEDYEVDILD